MNDFLGQELKEGDDVVCAVSHGRNSGATLVYGKVIKFTPKMVVVTCTDYTGRREETRRISSDKIIKTKIKTDESRTKKA